MKNIISFKRATQFSLILFSLLILFHLAIIIGIVFMDYVPIDFLWGGRMETKEQLLNFEIFSMGIMVFCLFTVIIRSKIIDIPQLLGISRIVLWVLFVLFVLNTVGNLLAKTNFERFFGILTVILAFLCLRLAMEKVSK